MTQAIPPPLPRHSRLAWWSLFLGVLSNMILPIIASIPCLICGHLALRAMRRDPALLGRKNARTGLGLGYLSIGAVVLLYFLWRILDPLMRDALPLLREAFY